MLLVTSELEPQDAAVVREHLSVCADCTARYDDLFDFREGFAREFMARSLAGLSEKLAAEEARRGWKRPLRFAGTVAASVAVLVSSILWLTTPVPMSAKQVLSNALDAEQRRPYRAVAVRVRSGRTGCAATRSQKAWMKIASTPGCEHFNEVVSKVRWDWDNPLSARSFNQWRDSLPEKADKITENADNVNLETRTETGELRFAALTIKRSDYTPLELQLGVEGLDTLSLTPEISADAAKIATAAPPLPIEGGQEAVRIEASAIDAERRAADEREVLVRETLHQLSADRGYETVLRRNGNKILVLGLAADEQRREELEARLRSISGVRIQIAVYGDPAGGEFLAAIPPRAGRGIGPALLDEHLKALLGSTERIHHFKNEVLAISQKITGLARVYDELQQRLPELSSCPCAQRLSSIESAYADESRQLLVELEQRLQLLFPNASLSRTVLLSSPDAQRLDGALLALLDASAQGSSADQELLVVHLILQ